MADDLPTHTHLAVANVMARGIRANMSTAESGRTEEVAQWRAL
jgi:hypothetical protein